MPSQKQKSSKKPEPADPDTHTQKAPKVRNPTEGSDSEDQNYKIIIAIKQVKEHTHHKHPNVNCQISIQGKIKNVMLPFVEGQFFGLRTLSPSDTIVIKFVTASVPPITIGEMQVLINEENTTQKESEILQEFRYTYEYDGQELILSGSFYAIILNKSVFLKENQQANPSKSPRTVQFQDIGEDKSPAPKRAMKRHPTGGQPLKRQATSDIKGKDNEIDPVQLQDKIEKSVKNAMKELQNAHELEESDPQYQPNRISLQRAQTIQQVEEATGGRISESVQIMRQSTKYKQQDSSFEHTPSPTKLEKTQTFLIDDQEAQQSPNRLSSQRSKTMKSSFSPTRHTDSYDHHCHENLTCLYYIDQANQSDQYKIQTDYLKKVIYALDKRLKAQNLVDEQNKKFQGDLEKQELDRQGVLKNLERTQRESDDLKGHINDTIKGLMNDKAQLAEQLNRMDKDFEKLKTENRQLQNELQQQKLKNQDQQNRLEDNSKQLQRIKDLEKALQQAEDRADEAEKRFQARAQEMGDLLDLAHRQRQGTDLKLSQAQQKQLEFQNELENEQLKNQELQQQIQKLNGEILQMKNKDGNSKFLQDQVNQLQHELHERQKSKATADMMTDQLRKQLAQLHNQILEKEKQFTEKTKELRKQIQNAINQEQATNKENCEKTKQNILLKQELKNTQLAAGLAQDYLKQLEEEKNRCQHYFKSQQALLEQNQEFSQTIHNLSKQVNQLQAHNQQLNQELQDSDSYAQNLKKLICELQEKDIVYIPYHNDPIDKALADYINSYYDPDKLNGLFVREGEGIYQFGTKKLYIKIEQDKILIRTGGGFIGIEEFLDLYTPQELEKMQRIGPQAQKSKNESMTSTMDKKGKIVKEIVSSHMAPLKPRTVGPVFTRLKEEHP